MMIDGAHAQCLPATLLRSSSTSRMRRLVGRLAAALVLLGVAQGDAGGALYTVETKEIITTLERNHVRDDRRLVAVGGLGRAARGRMAPLLSRPAAPAPSLLRLCVCSVPSPHSPRPPRRRRRFVAALSDATHDATRRDDACDRDSRSLARAAGRAAPPARTHTHTHTHTRTHTPRESCFDPSLNISLVGRHFNVRT